MLKPPPGLTSINHRRPRQTAILALLTSRPHSFAELKALTGMTTTNLRTLCQKLIAKAAIIPNPETGKYEIYPKKP